MNELDTQELLDALTDHMPYNLGRAMYCMLRSVEDDDKEDALRQAAHYLGRELDKIHNESEETIDPDFPVVGRKVEGKCLYCENFTEIDEDTKLCDICTMRKEAGAPGG